MKAKQQVYVLEHFPKRAQAGEFETIAVVAVSEGGKMEFVSTPASGLFTTALHLAALELADGLKRKIFQSGTGGSNSSDSRTA
jgi:hypothetical protein